MTVVVGCDFDTHSIWLCAIDPDDKDAAPIQANIALRDGGELVEAIMAVPAALAMAVGRMGLVPSKRAEAWVERGTGASRVGDWPLGAIAGAIVATWPRIQGGAAARIIKAADWKRDIGAPGNCGKPVANHYATLQWRSRYPDVHPPTNHNALDAFGICLAGSMR